MPLPGETALIAAAVLARPEHHHYSLVGVIVVAAAGAIVGDNIGYWLGRVGGRQAARPLGADASATPSKVLPPSERFFEKHGAKTVFFGRFIALLRVTAAWLAGISHMPWWRFFVWNAAGGIVWAPASRCSPTGPARRSPRRSATTASTACSARSRRRARVRRAEVLAGTDRRAVPRRRDPAPMGNEMRRWGGLAADNARVDDPDESGHAAASPRSRCGSPRRSAPRRSASRRSGSAGRCTTSASSRSTRDPAQAGPLDPTSSTRSARIPNAASRCSTATTSLRDALDCVLHHHERWDGAAIRTGSPATRSRSRRASSRSPTPTTR